MKTLTSLFTLASAAALAAEYHVAVQGNDTNDGSAAKPLQTISAAARLAQPGDVVTVHAGAYRERVNPPRGGTSDTQRITYQAAPGEQVVITGSELVKGWEKVTNDTWKVTLPNRFFGSFNPYRDLIHGDWFTSHGRSHHTGAVYVNGHWLTESAKLDDVLKPATDKPLWITDHTGSTGGGYLLNVAWLRPGKGDEPAGRIAADRFAAQSGIQAAACSEGGQCIGWIEDGDWVRYERVDFGTGTDTIVLRAASPGTGGVIELRLDSPTGDLLGTCQVSGTGDWQKWNSFRAAIKPTSGARTLCLVFKSPRTEPVSPDLTTIWAQFKGLNPNDQGIEINARQTVFYPDQPGRNFITVRGFTLEHAAPPWAPPTAEQKGLIGTHWSKGWIIENNVIRYSRCSGVALGKYGDEWDNRAESAEGYVGTLTRALTNGWNKATVGGHIVRNNHISHCEQTGVVGSLGCSFSTVTGNEIHDCHVLRLFSGAEQAGIKFHGAIDVEISHNHIYRNGSFAIWLDWMAQGARVTGNLLHDNLNQDLFMEVDHGPFVVDNNIMLSRGSQLIVSRGGAFAHNLIAGALHLVDFDGRLTPFHQAHSTAVAGLTNNPSGDMRYYNNVFAQRADHSAYDKARLPVAFGGNVFLKGAKPCKHEAAPLLKPDFDPELKLTEQPDGWFLELALDPAWGTEQPRQLVTTAMLGRSMVPNLPFENPDGSPLRILTDYFGKPRSEASPFPGPFASPAAGRQSLKVWPLAAR
jgi:alpha-N-arabinofuranosidase